MTWPTGTFSYWINRFPSVSVTAALQFLYVVFQKRWKGYKTVILSQFSDIYMFEQDAAEKVFLTYLPVRMSSTIHSSSPGKHVLLQMPTQERCSLRHTQLIQPLKSFLWTGFILMHLKNQNSLVTTNMFQLRCDVLPMLKMDWASLMTRCLESPDFCVRGINFFSWLTAVVFALQDGGVEGFGHSSIWSGRGQQWGVVPLSLLHWARLMT